MPGPDARIRHVAFEHPLFSPQGRGRIYCHDSADRPFATDAGKFAFFGETAATFVGGLQQLPEVVHLHDWHAATYNVLRSFDENLEALRSVRTVFTIHNLAYQGTRPISGDEASLEAWFPQLRYTHSSIRDPHLAHCYNPMAAAIRLADRVSTVSPTYATEICRASDGATGFIGGEGLEQELTHAHDEGRLVGIASL